MLILFLCNHYKIINDNITINSSTLYYKKNFINEKFFSKCAKILFELNYLSVDCVVDNGFYYFNLKKNNI